MRSGVQSSQVPGHICPQRRPALQFTCAQQLTGMAASTLASRQVEQRLYSSCYWAVCTLVSGVRSDSPSHILIKDLTSPGVACSPGFLTQLRCEKLDTTNMPIVSVQFESWQMHTHTPMVTALLAAENTATGPQCLLGPCLPGSVGLRAGSDELGRSLGAACHGSPSAHNLPPALSREKPQQRPTSGSQCGPSSEARPSNWWLWC